MRLSENMALVWLLKGEVGVSSKAMLGYALHLMSEKEIEHSYPRDYSDRYRCIKMLRFTGLKIPEGIENINSYWKDQVEKINQEMEEIIKKEKTL